MTAPTVSSRIFLVGCPRSGTTLLQCILAANSEIVSFPETHFYERIMPGRKLAIALGLAARRSRTYWEAFLHEIGHPEMGSHLPTYAVSLAQYSAAFVRVLDALCLEQDRCKWLEKTPGHLRRIPYIERLVAGSRFVHIMRNGQDTIASMFHVANQYADSWAPWYGTLDQCIDRWVRDVELSLAYQGRHAHRLVAYERLLREPEIVLRGLCEFLEIAFQPDMLTEYAHQADRLVHDREAWKNSVREPIWTRRRSRFEDYLDEGQREYVQARIPGKLRPYFTPEPETP